MIHVPTNTLRVNIIFLNTLISISVTTILTPNPHIIYHFAPLLFKSATHLSPNTSHLVSHMGIHLPTILPSNYHWNNLATTTLSTPCLHITNLPIVLLALNTPTYLLVKLHTSNLINNSIIKCLFSLTNVLLPIIHLPRWVNIPTNMLGIIKSPPSNLLSYLLFNLPIHIPTKLPSTKTLFKLSFSFSTRIHLPINQADILPFKSSLTPVAHLTSMLNFLEDITHNTMHLAPSGPH